MVDAEEEEGSANTQHLTAEKAASDAQTEEDRLKGLYDTAASNLETAN